MDRDKHVASDKKADYRVLVVDDEERMRELLFLHLKNEFDVDTAASGEEALAMMGRKRYDLVVLDILMPGKDGWEVCQSIRAQYDVPVMMLTALTGVDEKLEAFSAGADDYITKPFDARELMARAKALIRRGQSGTSPTAAPGDVSLKPGYSEDDRSHRHPSTMDTDDARGSLDPSILRFPELVIDPFRRLVTCQGVRVHVTPMEFDLLYYMAKSPERVFSRSELLKDVWEDEGFVETRTVDSHVKTLRDKLGRKGVGRVIATVWGTGYKFDPARIPSNDGSARETP